MLRKNRIRLRWILILLLTLTATSLSVTAQTVSVQGSVTPQPVTQVAPSGVSRTATVVDDCKDALETAEKRLLKALDALERAERLLSAKDAELVATASLIALYKQAIEVKDLIIKFQDEAIKKMSKRGWMTKLKDAFGLATKVALLITGVLIAR